MDIAKLISKYYPGKSWTLNGDEYSGLVWHSETPIPTLEELEAKQVLYEAELMATEYQELRKAEYPSWQDQLDMMFHDFDNWKATIQAIKNKYPKPVLVVEPEIVEEMEAEPLILPEEEVTL